LFSSELIEQFLRVALSIYNIGVQDAVDGFKHLAEDRIVPKVFDHLHGVREGLVVGGIAKEVSKNKFRTLKTEIRCIDLLMNANG